MRRRLLPEAAPAARPVAGVVALVGAVPALERGRWIAAAELGAVPRLSADEQRVGFDGVKQEDLNRSPVFGRVRGVTGLGDGWVAELAWTPPLEIDRAKPRDLFAAAIGKRIVERSGTTLSLRAFGQHGIAEGDITCPARLAKVTDPVRNPFGCRAASDDQIALDYYGIEGLYVPLTVTRNAQSTGSYDPFATVRVQLRYRFN